MKGREQAAHRYRSRGTPHISVRRGGIMREKSSVSGHRSGGLTNALTYAGRTASAVLLEEPESFAAELLQEENAEAKAEAEKDRPVLVMFTDGSWLDSGAAGYLVV